MGVLMTDRYYSATTGGFYLVGVHTDIPSDAVAVSDDDFTALMDAQAAGSQIAAGDTGTPVATIRTQTTAELLTALRAKRDNLLKDCDFTQLADCPLSDDLKTAWQTYRASLRDLPQTYADNPADVVWPDQPATTSTTTTES